MTPAGVPAMQVTQMAKYLTSVYVSGWQCPCLLRKKKRNPTFLRTHRISYRSAVMQLKYAGIQNGPHPPF